MASSDIIQENLDKDCGSIVFGSSLLNLALTGKVNRGIDLGRIARIFGPSGAGKSLLAIDLFRSLGERLPVNPKTGQRYENKRLLYIDLEYGLNMDNARGLGLPEDVEMYPNNREDPNQMTVEFVHKKIKEFLLDKSYGKPETTCGLVVIDSIDALTTLALKSYIDDGKMEEGKGMMTDGKPKLLGIMCKDLVSLLEATNTALVLISQIRDNVGGLGSPVSVSGGKALQFYSSQMVQVKNVRDLVSSKTNLSYGWSFDVFISKNRISAPHRTVTLYSIYNYGLDDISSLLEFVGLHPKRAEVELKRPGGRWLCWFDTGEKKRGLFKEDIIEEISSDASRYNELVEMGIKVWKKLEEETMPVRSIRFGPTN